MQPLLVAPSLIAPFLYYWLYTRRGLDAPNVAHRMNKEDSLFSRVGYVAAGSLVLLMLELVITYFWQFELLELVVTKTRIVRIATIAYYACLALRAYRAVQTCSAAPTVEKKFMFRLTWSIINCLILIIVTTMIEG